MPKGYWVVHVTVTNPDAYAEYVRLDTPVIERFGGRFLVRGDRVKFLKNHLVQRGVIQSEREVQLLHRFLDTYLKQDGAFLLRLIAHNTNNITYHKPINTLWMAFPCLSSRHGP